jgi:multiple sugar transport system permease protein
MTWAETILLAIFLLGPFAATAWKSLLALDPSRPESYGTFVGLANYVELLTHEPAFRNSLLASVLFISIVLIQSSWALLLAIWLRFLWPSRLPAGLVVLLVTPLLVSPTVVALIGRLYLHDQVGIASRALKVMGLLESTEAPLGSARGAWISLACLDAWQWLPFTALLFWWAFQLIPRRQIEASKVDGLPDLMRLRYVELPHLAGPIAVVVLLRMLEGLRTFDLPQILTGGGPGISTLMASLYANRVTFNQQRFGIGAAHLQVLEMAAYVLILFLIRRLQLLRGLLHERAS